LFSDIFRSSKFLSVQNNKILRLEKVGKTKQVLLSMEALTCTLRGERIIEKTSKTQTFKKFFIKLNENEGKIK